jgi:hypothetical protein
METLVIEQTATGYHVYVMGSPRRCAEGVTQAEALSNFLSEFHDYFVIVRDAEQVPEKASQAREASLAV